MNISKSTDISKYYTGSNIHIKKKNKGKFTEYCDGEVTQNCIDKAKNSGNPTLKKRAIFAENARSWKHAKGGQLIPKHKIGYVLDYDPKNPYHVHSNGEKIVITPEQYEKHKDEPYFANIRKQVEEHQTAYPDPEYTETPNPEYRKVYANVKSASNQHFKEHNFNGQTYREYSVVPEAYFRNSVDGVVTDEQGNLYRPMTQADVGRGVTPMFTTTERDYHDGRNFNMSWVRVKTPAKTIKTLKQPLPVDRTYNVDEELDIIYKQPYEYHLIWGGPDYDYNNLPRTNHLLDTVVKRGHGYNRNQLYYFAVPSDYYQKLKKKFTAKDEQNYFSTSVKPVYPTKDYVNKNIQLKIN
jgi:hypothetical protein